MEDSKYATERNISLGDILSCITDAGYKASEDNHQIMGNVLHVYYDVQNASETTEELYCRWAKEEDAIHALDAEQVSKFTSYDSQLKVLFNVQYREFGFQILSKILRAVLDCYDGVIYYKGSFFDKHTILDFQNGSSNR